MRFVVRQTDEMWESYDTDTDIVMDTWGTKKEAQADVDSMNNCKHIDLEPPEWASEAHVDIKIWCRNCGREAIIPLPSNLEWE